LVGSRDRRAVGQGIAEGNLDFNEVGAAPGRGEAPAASGRLAGALDGRGSPGRIFLIKLSYAGGGGPGDFRLIGQR